MTSGDQQGMAALILRQPRQHLDIIPIAGNDLVGAEQQGPVAFDAGKDREDQLPAYELSFRYFEDGVTSDLKIDYGEFAIKGELKELTFLDPGKCPASARWMPASWYCLPRAPMHP